MQRTQRRGFTLPSLIVSIASGLVLLSLLTVTSCGGNSESSANSLARVAKDASHLRQLHTGIVAYAGGDQNRSYPRPGLIWRLPIDGQAIIGQGPERNDVNTTANLYSAMICEHYVPTSVLISPLEVNPVVREDLDYDYSAIQPMQSVFWDPGFKADIATRNGESNTSYAHLAICGERKGQRWRYDTKYASQEPVFSTRGVRDGKPSGDDYVKSPTLRFIAPKNRWIGNVVFNDNHVERLESFYDSRIFYEDEYSVAGRMKDNIFAAEFGINDESRPESGAAAADTWLIIAETASADGYSCTAAWDALLDS